MPSILSFSQCTPYDYKSGQYNIFKSNYKSLRFLLPTYSTYVVGAEDCSNLPGISYKVYGTTDLWRVILDFNGLSDPLNDIYPGLTLNLPNKSDLLIALSGNEDHSANKVVI